VAISFTLTVDPNYRALELGFLQGSNPSAYKRLMSFATVNAARTYAKPIKDAAPRGKTGNLAAGVKARSGRYSKPSAVVGPLFAGRGSKKNPWYRWLVVKGSRIRHLEPYLDHNRSGRSSRRSVCANG
jgi:hypothetical protein